MSNVYNSKNVEQTSENPVVKTKRSKKRKIAFVVGVVGAGLLPIAAYAAVQLFGFGTLDSAAATTQNLTVNNESAQLVGKLVPGSTVGAKAVVNNPNDFPVTVTAVIVRNSSLAVTPNTADCQNTVHVIGSATTWPGDGGGAGTLQAIESNVTIAAHSAGWVTVPQAVKQDESATTLCGVHAEFAVRAQTAS